MDQITLNPCPIRIFINLSINNIKNVVVFDGMSSQFFNFFLEFREFKKGCNIDC